MATNNFDHLPNRVRFHRKQLGLTLEALAERIGTSYVQLSRLETGDRPLNMHWLERLSTALDVPAAELISGDQNPYLLDTDEKQLIDIVRAGGPALLQCAIVVTQTLLDQFKTK